ncbi:MAG: DUF1059 domain-containing protein [Kangiellaceae bacterium]|nr:DUF1059 domain-containing protein [Kangiellaceae bacterium]
MKTMTCNQLGGACKKAFSAETFEELAELSKQHGAEMFKQQDKAHLEAMGKMQVLMKKPGEMEQWFNARRAEFEALAMD